MRKTLVQIVTMIAAGASVLAAQTGTQPRRPAPGVAGQPTPRMQARMGDMLKQRFGFNDSQVAKFDETNRKFGERARLIGEQDRDVRMAIREEMLRPDSARSSQLNALLDKQAAVRRQRADLADAREKELASFLTPLQRAKLSNERGAMRGAMRDRMRDRMRGHMRGGMHPGMMEGMHGMRGPRGGMRP